MFDWWMKLWNVEILNILFSEWLKTNGAGIAVKIVNSSLVGSLFPVLAHRSTSTSILYITFHSVTLASSISLSSLFSGLSNVSLFLLFCSVEREKGERKKNWEGETVEESHYKSYPWKTGLHVLRGYFDATYLWFYVGERDFATDLSGLLANCSLKEQRRKDKKEKDTKKRRLRRRSLTAWRFETPASIHASSKKPSFSSLPDSSSNIKYSLPYTAMKKNSFHLRGNTKFLSFYIFRTFFLALSFHLIVFWCRDKNVYVQIRVSKTKAPFSHIGPLFLEYSSSAFQCIR